MKVFAPDHPLVVNGTYDVEGYTPKERRAQARKGQLMSTTPKETRMFVPHTAMTLSDVTFTTETVDEAVRRVVICTFTIAPFTAAQADALNVRSLLFDTATGLPKDAIDTIVLNIAMPLQRLTFAMAPDQTDHRVILADVAIEPKLRAKVKKDRDPLAVDATLKVSFRYPDADVLLYIANGVDDVHYLTFEAQQGELALGEELRPGVFAEH